MRVTVDSAIMNVQEQLNEARNAAAARYKPQHIRLLLVAQMPPVAWPPDPPRYFYFANVSKHDDLFRAVVSAILSVEPDRDAKPQLLGRLRDQGVFLIDLKTDPSDPRSLTDCVPSLLARCSELRPDRIILIKADVYDAAFTALRAGGMPVVDARIPFPGSGRQREFAKAFAKASAASVCGAAMGNER